MVFFNLRILCKIQKCIWKGFMFSFCSWLYWELRCVLGLEYKPFCMYIIIGDFTLCVMCKSSNILTVCVKWICLCHVLPITFCCWKGYESKTIKRYSERTRHETRLLRLEVGGYVKGNMDLEIGKCLPGMQLHCPSDLLVETVSCKMWKQG